MQRIQLKAILWRDEEFQTIELRCCGYAVEWQQSYHSHAVLCS